MKKYIDYDSLEQEAYEMVCHARQQVDLTVANTIKSMIDAQPDALIRCKDCKYLECTDLAGDCICDINGEHHDPDWFCADGERKGETEIIRCKDCKHFIAENQPCKYRGMYIPLKPDNYCSHGERRDDDD